MANIKKRVASIRDAPPDARDAEHRTRSHLNPANCSCGMLEAVARSSVPMLEMRFGGLATQVAGRCLMPNLQKRPYSCYKRNQIRLRGALPRSPVTYSSPCYAPNIRAKREKFLALIHISHENKPFSAYPPLPFVMA